MPKGARARRARVLFFAALELLQKARLDRQLAVRADDQALRTRFTVIGSGLRVAVRSRIHAAEIPAHAVLERALAIRIERVAFVQNRVRDRQNVVEQRGL